MQFLTLFFLSAAAVIVSGSPVPQSSVDAIASNVGAVVGDEAANVAGVIEERGIRDFAEWLRLGRPGGSYFRWRAGN